MSSPQLKEQDLYTYADYLTWDDAARWEIIDGEAYMMAPAPSLEHQSLTGDLFSRIYNYLKGKSCRAFVAPFDVRLDADTTDDTVVQPDIVIVCDLSKLDKRGCTGAPDMVIEILSPSTALYDTTIKYRKYREAGIREYWVVNPETKTIQVHTLENGKYVTEVYFGNDEIKVGIFDDLTINIGEVFAQSVI